jgi:hypothetical protein
MHTATRLFLRLVDRVRSTNPEARLCAYGLYAPLNAAMLGRAGIQTIIGGEFEQGLVDWARGDSRISSGVSLARQRFLVPDRTGMPPLAAYAKLVVNGATHPVGYTEASRGCKHLCRHCPVVPVYRGQFRVVQQDVVLADIRQQVAVGAEHITFGDPDFLNGPGHAIPIVEALHREWPTLTYDATIKIEHLLKHRELLPRLRATGCLFVTSAVESVDDAVLSKLEKGHTRADFIQVAREFRSAGLTLAPTFIPFTPWTKRASYRELLELLMELDLVEQVAPVQLALRLLIPRGSRLLELPDLPAVIQGFDEPALLYRWRHPDPEVDALAAEALRIAASRGTRREVFGYFWNLVSDRPLLENFDLLPRAAIPYLDEPWFC